MLKHLHNIVLTKERSLNHGNLTFENIIVGNDNKIWLIDYSGSFYPHYWLDLATLLQDLDGRWYEIKSKIKINEKKVDNLKEYLMDKVTSLDEDYIKHHSFFMSLVFLRILPYAQSEEDKQKILHKIESFLKQ